MQTPPDPVDRLTERLGEFLMGPGDSPSISTAIPTGEAREGNHSKGQGAGGRKRKATVENPSSGQERTMAPLGFESDGLTDKVRNGL